MLVIRVGMQGIRVGIREIKVGMRGIGVIFLRIFVCIASPKMPLCEGEHLTIHLLWAAARLLVTRFLPCLPNR